MSATKAYIHISNLKHNIRQMFSAIARNTRVCMAVKADAYGHGAEAVYKAAEEEGITYFAVSSIDEARELRSYGSESDILLLGLLLPNEMSEAVNLGIEVIAGDRAYISLLEQEAKQSRKALPVHLKVDTGMGRLGCAPENAPDLAAQIHNAEGLMLQGLCTHFPISDDENSDFTQEQTEIFKNTADTIKGLGIPVPYLHTSNSGAVIGHSYTHLSMVRPGIMLYGYYPSGDQERYLDLKPVMEFTSKVMFIKTVKKATSISYGRTYFTKEKTRIATIPAGYGDGYNRLLSNKGEVLIRGKRYKIAGRVCMDQFMVDLGPASDVQLYDAVTLFGPAPEGPDAEEIAQLIGTIPYEVTCNVSKRVERIVIPD
ncbi:MAG: alanine racemase [Spirochaetia bacterium]